VLAVILTSCAVGRPQGFTSRTNSFCSDALASYSALEKAVSQLTDSSLPGGETGAALRERWLRPARTSLTEGRATLRQLRDAVHDDNRTAADAAFASTRQVGRAGVDTAWLSASGLDRCATLFTSDSSA